MLLKDINAGNAGLALKLAAVALIVISGVFIIKSVGIYKKYAAAHAFYAQSLKKRNNLSARLKNLEEVKTPEFLFGNRSVKTYLLTFLSFVNYINSKGYAAQASIKLPQIVKPGLKTQTAEASIKLPQIVKPGLKTQVAGKLGSYNRLGSYITNSISFYAVKKIGLSLKINDIHDIKTVLKVIGDVQELFPTRISSVLITGKIAVINFNIYGGK